MGVKLIAGESVGLNVLPEFVLHIVPGSREGYTTGAIAWSGGQSPATDNDRVKYFMVRNAWYLKNLWNQKNDAFGKVYMPIFRENESGVFVDLTKPDFVKKRS